MTEGAPLLEQLADGRRHSGERLARELGVSRAAVAKRVARLREAGWPITAERGRGYRLEAGAAPLDPARIGAALAPAEAAIADWEVLSEVDSTSARLAARELPGDGRARVCVAERQTAGRGRRGRTWFAVPGGSIALSVARTFAVGPAHLMPLGLVAGVGVARALRSAGVTDVGLKWPNDLRVGPRKLAGILVEVNGEQAGPTRATVGVGVNCDLRGLTRGIHQPVTDVRTALGRAPDRDLLVADIIRELLTVLAEYAHAGADSLLREWSQLDALWGRKVRVSEPGGTVTGRAAGVDRRGALRLETPEGVRCCVAGDASLREAP